MLSKTLIYYFHYNSKESTNGLAPIYCRITVNSTPKKFATGLYVQANNWDTVKQKAKGRNEEVQFINFKLDCLTMEKPRDFDPFGQTGMSPLATI